MDGVAAHRGVEDLPYDVLLLLLGGCDVDTVCRLSQTCQRFRLLSRDDVLWERMHLRRWSRADVEAPQPSWRSDYVRRHAKDCNAVRCVRDLCDARAARSSASRVGRTWDASTVRG